MSDISRTALFGKLDPILYKAIEGATVFCKLRGNPYVELVHWLHQLIQLNDSDLHRILRHYNIDQGRLATELTKALDALPAGATSLTDLSQHVESAVERGWVYSTLLYGDDRIRGGTLLVGMLKTPSLRSVLATAAASLTKLDADTLARELPSIVRGSPEDGLAANDGTRLAGAGADAGGTGELDPSKSQQSALQRYAIDLTARARAGEIDPVTGRDEEIRQIIDILMRRRQNNPLLAGEAGVGKTAVVEGFALRLAQGDVPPQLKDVALLMLDIGLLQAGAGIKGEFEQRLRQVIDEVQASPRPIIIFIDEAHTLIGAGGAAGTGDAANLLKPALARGTLRTIGATTWSEYKRHIEKDPALTRRFQLIQIGEPDETRAIAMVRGIADTLEKHHGVHLLDEAIAAAVRLSYRYIPARQLPDKAVSLLDTACARVAISQHAPPAAVEDCQKRIEILRTELAIIERESAIGLDVAEREATCRAQLDQFETQLQELETRWQRERDLANRLFELRSALRQEHAAEIAAAAAEGAPPPVTDEAAPPPDAAPSNDVPATESSAEPSAEQRDEHTRLHRELTELQGEDPLVHPAVDAAAVASVVADWTGIPVGRMVRNEIEAVLNLVTTLDRRIVSQRHALERIASRVQTSRAKLDNPDRPVGVFLLVGPSGVGKTETALALADTLYGGEHNLITLNMSEFQEAHTVSTLKGAPPGYVGYGEGGVLTEAVRRKPHSVVLLDEIEKAHPDVHEIFFQVFDKGWMEDGEGRHIDFRNTIILLTSNVGTDRVMALARDVEQLPTPETLADALRKPLLEVFPPAFLGRLVVIPYYPLANDSLALIVKLQLDRIRQRIVEQHAIDFDYDSTAVDLVIRRCTELDSGARMIDAILTHTVLPHISREFLSCLASDRPLRGIRLSATDSDFAYHFDTGEVLS